MEANKVKNIADFRKRQREQRRALGIFQIDPEEYKVSPDKPSTPEPPERGNPDYYIESNATKPPKPKAQGSFRMGGVDYILHNGEWRAKNKDGSIMNPKEWWDFNNPPPVKPGTVTGKPLSLR